MEKTRSMTGTVHTVIVSKADMMRYYDPERIQGYCRTCEKYGQFWSCPPFESSPLEQLPPWTHAILVTQKTWVEPGSTKERLIEQFLAARQILVNTLKHWERDGCLSVIAGHCSGCSKCTRPRGIACQVPSRMRYSLEALGFDVTALAKKLAGQSLHWPKSGVPDYLLTVGALLCRDQALALAWKQNESAMQTAPIHPPRHPITIQRRT